MERLYGLVKDYAWGSPQAIAQFVAGYPQEVKGAPPLGAPVAELWFGDHWRGSATLASGKNLASAIECDPLSYLGKDVAGRFGCHLPFLLKVIAPDHPLSLQVHPGRKRAKLGWAKEEALNVARTSARRSYPDRNHKPELIYALTQFEAMSGFRAPRRAAEIFAGLPNPLAKQIHHILVSERGSRGLKKVAKLLLQPPNRQLKGQVEILIAQCKHRLKQGDSPSIRADRQALLLAEAYPNDPGVVLSLLLNPVTLQPGQALFTPPGYVHAYISGLGVEIMSTSDNVLRAGLTPKHIDVRQALKCMDFHGAPPVRIAPEMISAATGVFYAPVDDFELSVTEISRDQGQGTQVVIAGHGPRIALCVAGEVLLQNQAERCRLLPGQAVFVRSEEGPVIASGQGQVVQAGLP